MPSQHMACQNCILQACALIAVTCTTAYGRRPWQKSLHTALACRLDAVLTMHRMHDVVSCLLLLTLRSGSSIYPARVSNVWLAVVGCVLSEAGMVPQGVDQYALLQTVA
jgi:hypothetical protein